MVKKIVIASLVLFVLICTISDIYYSKLEREYPLLTDQLPIEGVITDYRVHWRYSYITVNSTKKILIRPMENKAYVIKHFDELIEIGDSIFKKRDLMKLCWRKKE